MYETYLYCDRNNDYIEFVTSYFDETDATNFRVYGAHTDYDEAVAEFELAVFKEVHEFAFDRGYQVWITTDGD